MLDKEKLKEKIDEIKKTNPLFFFNFDTKLAKTSNGYLINSPLRKDNEASLSFFKTKKGEWLFKDHATGEVFDFIGFISRFYGVGFVDAVKKILNSDLSDIKIENLKIQQTRKKESAPPEVTYFDRVKSLALKKYLQKRKIFKIPSFAYEIRYKIGDNSYYGIAIQNFNKSFEIRTVYKKIALGAKDIFLRKTDSRITFVTEGMFDMFSMYQFAPGINYVCLNSVTNINREKLIQMKILLENKDIILGFDNDKAGKEAVNRFIELLDKMNINFNRLIILSDEKEVVRNNIFKVKIYDAGDIKDLNELLVSGRTSFLKKVLSKVLNSSQNTKNPSKI